MKAKFESRLSRLGSSKRGVNCVQAQVQAVFNLQHRLGKALPGGASTRVAHGGAVQVEKCLNPGLHTY